MLYRVKKTFYWGVKKGEVTLQIFTITLFIKSSHIRNPCASHMNPLVIENMSTSLTFGREKIERRWKITNFFSFYGAASYNRRANWEENKWAMVFSVEWHFFSIPKCNGDRKLKWIVNTFVIFLLLNQIELRTKRKLFLLVGCISNNKIMSCAF